MKPAEIRALIAGARWFDVELPPDAIARIGRFLAVLAVWNRRLRLIGDRDLRKVVETHVVDSLAPVPFLPAGGLVIDIGSGGGFPGIILGCLRPDLELTLIESRRRPVSFLREVIRSVPLPLTRVLELRAEDAARDPALAGRATAVIARALRLDSFLGLAAPFLAPTGVAIAMQTPRTAALAEPAAERLGLRVLRRRDYTLPGGAARALIFFASTVS